MKMQRNGYIYFKASQDHLLYDSFFVPGTDEWCYKVSDFWTFKNAQKHADDFNSWHDNLQAKVFKESKLLKPYRVFILSRDKK